MLRCRKKNNPLQQQYNKNQQLIEQLQKQLDSNVQDKGQISGGLLFIFSEPSKADAQVLHFQMAFPVSKAPNPRGQRFRIEEDAGYYAASLIVKDKPEELINYWPAFYQQIVADGHELSMTARQNILEAKEGHIKAELLIGLKHKE